MRADARADGGTYASIVLINLQRRPCRVDKCFAKQIAQKHVGVAYPNDRRLYTVFTHNIQAITK